MNFVMSWLLERDDSNSLICYLVITIMPLLLTMFFVAGAPYADHESGDNPVETIQVIWVDLGSNLTIPCGSISSTSPGGGSENGGDAQSVMWIHEGRGSSVSNHVQKDGSIFFQKLQLSDSGVYSCSLEYSAEVESGEEETDEPNNKNNINKNNGLSQSQNWIPYEARFQIRVRSKLPK